MSDNAKRDENNIATMLSVLNTDGETLTRVQVNASNHALAVDDNTDGTDSGPDHILRDENNISILFAVSEDDDETLVPLYVDSSGKLLIDSN